MENQKNLIVNLFNNKFNLKDYINFTQEVFKGKAKYGNNLEFSPKVKGEFNSVVKSFLNLGRYIDDNKKSMILAVVELRGENSIARSRTIQRNFVKDYFLKGGADSALVAFYNNESYDWRLSFIKLDYSYKNSKLQEDITPAKRFSFLLGKNEKHHTAVERFMPLIVEDKEAPSIDELEEVFNIEVVTKEFFEKYCDLYLKIKNELDNQEGFSLVAKKSNIKSDEFSKKLMGQLVFLYFLQKKGWLGVKVNPDKISKKEAEALLENKTYEFNDVFYKVYYLSDDLYIRNEKKLKQLTNEEINWLNSIFINTKYDEKWGSGDKSFIRSMFKEADSCGKSFFKDYLEPIFYNALNDKRGGSTYFKDLNCKVPFLNGGLFQPISESYNYKNADFTIDNSLFSNNNKNKQGEVGDGVLDIFDRYAFTIKEDEPLEKEVAVDPEMLGKVFENLLDITDRKKKGAFYTPREIVHYMCQESLINYLTNEINLSYDEAEALIRYGDIINDIDLSKNTMNSGNYKMPFKVRSQAKRIDNALENVKVADPAVGSGAFPLGMVNEIVRARMNLTHYMLNDLEAVTRNYKTKKERSTYELKKKAIKNSIHAVDIERSAVDITKLRLWLSLVIEENDFSNVQALPNLDYNIMVGNSLIEEFQGVKLFNENIIKYNEEDNIENQIKLKINNEEINNLLEVICELESKLKLSSNIIEARNIQYQLEEAKKSYNEIAASVDVRVKSENVLDEIYRLQEEFFEANSREKKIVLKNRIDTLEWLLIEQTVKESGNSELIEEIKELKRTNTKPYFLWRLNFAKTFKEKGGFDIVIGNPPYIGEAKGKEAFIPVQKSEFGKKYYIGKMDFWYFFTSLGLEILKKNGNVLYIAPNNWMTTAGGKLMRKHISKEGTIKMLVNFGDNMVFESASQQTMIFNIQKNAEKLDFTVKYSELMKDIESGDELTEFLMQKKCDGFKYFSSRLNRTTFEDGASIQFLDERISQVIDSILLNKSTYLQKDEITNGIHPHHAKVTNKMLSDLEGAIQGDGIFVLNSSEVDDMNLDDYEKNLLKKCYSSKDINRYYFNDSNPEWIIYTESKFKDIKYIEQYPNIKRHLDKFNKVITSDNKPYGLHRARNKEFFDDEKIVSLRKCSVPTFSYISTESYVLAEYYIIKTKRMNMKYLTTILNSKLVKFWLRFMGKMQGKNFQVDKEPLLKIPIVIGTDEQIDRLLYLYDKRVGMNNENDISMIELEIDNIVYDIYNLEEDYRHLIEDTLIEYS